MNNHTYTIQIQTNHFDSNLSHKEYESVAQELLFEFDRAIESQGLRPYTTYHASWMKGCLIENIVLSFQNMDSTTQALTAMGSYVVLKDYSAISESVAKLVSHIRSVSFFVGDVSVRVVRVVVNRHESPSLKNRIEPRFGSLEGINDGRANSN